MYREMMEIAQKMNCTTWLEKDLAMTTTVKICKYHVKLQDFPSIQLDIIVTANRMFF
ncbi:hypothetical protein ACSBR2_015985 [Camellia fascicularis]